MDWHLLGVSVGPAVEGSITDESRLLGVGLLFLYVIVADRYLKSFNIPTNAIILFLGLLVVPLAGNNPFQVPGEFIHVLHLTSLNLILFTSGLSTKISTIRQSIKFIFSIATLSCLLTAVITGGLFFLITSPDFGAINFGIYETFPLGAALLMGACLSDTDGEAALRCLGDLRKKIPERLQNTIKFESLLNCATTIIIFGLFASFYFQNFHDSHFIVGSTIGQTFSAITKSLVALFSTGIIDGVVFGYLANWLFKTMQIKQSRNLVAGIAIVFINYATSNFLGGSGLISAFIAGLFISNADSDCKSSVANLKASIIPFNEAAEIFICIAFALQVNIQKVLECMPLGILCGLLMMFIARPISIGLNQRLSHLRWNELLLLSWCGLKGPVTFAVSFELVELISEFPGLESPVSGELADEIQSIIFIASLFNLLLQGISLKWVTTRLNVLEKPLNAPEQPSLSS